MKRIIYSFLITGAVLMVSCKKNITDLNINPTRPENVPSATLFSNAALNLSDNMAHTNVNINNYRLFVQYWTETIYRDETRYNLNQRSISDRWWANMYRDVIKDLAEASKVVDTETLLALTSAQIKNRKAINEILTVYAYYTLVTSFGNIPYDEALDIENLQPKYDDAKTVYGKLATRLNAAIGDLDNSTSAYGSADLILNDDIDAWERFAYSLKFRMGMLILDDDFATGSAMVLDAAPHVISANSENIMMHYLASPPNTNPVWEDLVQSGRHDFIAARPFMDSLKKYNDPRIPFYFNPAITGGDFLGETPGIRATFNNFSAPSDEVANPQHPHTYFSYSEMELLKAEAVERGIAIGGTAETHYNAGITASILEWGGSAADAAAYLAQPGVAYITSPGTYQQKIGLQLWFALYNRGYDAWTQWRRLDYPVLNVPSGALFASGETPSVIKRMTYPVIEQNLNKANYESASAAIGKDQITQRLWFDKN
jgi:Starch-binding associating with outer membrane